MVRGRRPVALGKTDRPGCFSMTRTETPGPGEGCGGGEASGPGADHDDVDVGSGPSGTVADCGWLNMGWLLARRGLVSASLCGVHPHRRIRAGY